MSKLLSLKTFFIFLLLSLPLCLSTVSADTNEDERIAGQEVDVETAYRLLATFSRSADATVDLTLFKGADYLRCELTGLEGQVTIRIVDLKAQAVVYNGVVNASVQPEWRLNTNSLTTGNEYRIDIVNGPQASLRTTFEK